MNAFRAMLAFVIDKQAAIITLVLVAVGVGLIVLGAYMSLDDWKTKHDVENGLKPMIVDGTLEGLAKLVDALKGYPIGQQLIVWGIVVLLIAGLFGGITHFF